MGKLVRDLIPDIIRADGREPVTHVLDDAEYRTALVDKLFEEAEELRAAHGPSATEELADVLEVVHALAGVLGITVADLQQIADDKRAARGGFDERIWLV